jgi:hypothetical protein
MANGNVDAVPGVADAQIVHTSATGRIVVSIRNDFASTSQQHECSNCSALLDCVQRQERREKRRYPPE